LPLKKQSSYSNFHSFYYFKEASSAKGIETRYIFQIQTLENLKRSIAIIPYSILTAHLLISLFGNFLETFALSVLEGVVNMHLLMRNWDDTVAGLETCTETGEQGSV
jgi:hypothetical protein